MKNRSFKDTKNLVLDTIRMFANSQGFYSRLLRDIGYNGENIDQEWFEQFADCKTTLDVVLKLEQ